MVQLQYLSFVAPSESLKAGAIDAEVIPLVTVAVVVEQLGLNSWCEWAAIVGATNLNLLGSYSNLFGSTGIGGEGVGLRLLGLR